MAIRYLVIWPDGEVSLLSQEDWTKAKRDYRSSFWIEPEYKVHYEALLAAEEVEVEEETNQ